MLDTGGDLLVWEPRRHRTAALSKAELSAVWTTPLLCCRAGVASVQGVLSGVPLDTLTYATGIGVCVHNTIAYMYEYRVHVIML